MTLVEATNKVKTETNVQTLKSFPGEMRDAEIITFKEGDVFTIPQEFEIFGIKLAGSEDPVPFILVETNGKDGNGFAKRFFPSTFWKSRTVYTKDKIPTEKHVSVSGTAVDFVHKYTTVEEAMNALKGKKLKISKMTNVVTLSFRGNLVNTNIPVIDFVEDEK